jgi:hypothetical protein
MSVVLAFSTSLASLAALSAWNDNFAPLEVLSSFASLEVFALLEVFASLEVLAADTRALSLTNSLMTDHGMLLLSDVAQYFWERLPVGLLPMPLTSLLSTRTRSFSSLSLALSL